MSIHMVDSNNCSFMSIRLLHLTCFTDNRVQHSRYTSFDYCNALLCGAHEATFNKLQRVRNNLARIVCQRGGRADASPLLTSLHWLPVRQRVTYKMALTAHNVWATATPMYYSDLVQALAPAQALRSSNAPQMVVPWTNTNLARRAFSAAAPSIWNALPAELHSTMPQHCYIQTTPKDTSVYPQLVTPPHHHHHQRLCIFRLHGALQLPSLLFFNTLVIKAFRGISRQQLEFENAKSDT